MTKERKHKTLQELNLIDDFLFREVITYDKRGEELCRLLVETILGKKIKNFTIEAQRPMSPGTPDVHAILLDLYIEGTYEETVDNVVLRETDIVLDFEMQNQKKKFTPLRDRFYHSVISARLLKSGEEYSNLKKVCVIIILPEDPFHKGKMMYTVRRMVEGEPDIPFDDGAQTIYLYTKGEDNVGNPKLKELLKFIEHTSEENAVNKATKNINQLVNEVKNDGKVGVGYMKAIEYKEMYFEEGLTEGIELGRSEGIVKALASLVRDKILTLEEAAKRAGLSTDEFNRQYQNYL